MIINAGRLERLAGLLEQERPGDPKFDLSNWSEHRTKTTGHLWWKKSTLCHTTACAVGLACLSGEFARDGLLFEMENYGLVPVFGQHEYWDAVEVFFGLTKRQAKRLFSMNSYDHTSGPAAARAVAKRIRRMISASDAAHHRKIIARTKPAVAKLKELVGAD